MSYVVLARKWRPQHFEEVSGQEHVARTLKNAIDQDRVAHAFLFCGPRGVGKTSTARILAKALNCVDGPTPEPCYECASCTEISEGSSVDVIEIDGASNRGVNEIRELREGARYAPSRDRHKIYIIDEVHMLTTEAFNALLKTLEEPPPHVKFIFATTEPQKIPVTILSRCQRFDFKRIAVRKIIDRLQEICEAEGIEVEAGALSLIARQADGCMRDALSLLDQVISFCGGSITEKQVTDVLGIAGRDVLFRLTDALLGSDVDGALVLLDEVNQAGYDVMQFTDALVNHLRDLTVVRVAKSAEDLTDLTDEELAQAQEQVGGLDISVLNRMFNITIQAYEEMSHSSYPKLMFEMTLVKLAAVEPLAPMEPLLKRLEALESGVMIDLDSSGSSSPPASPGAGGGSGQGASTGQPEVQASATSAAAGGAGAAPAGEISAPKDTSPEPQTPPGPPSLPAGESPGAESQSKQGVNGTPTSAAKIRDVSDAAATDTGGGDAPDPKKEASSPDSRMLPGEPGDLAPEDGEPLEPEEARSAWKRVVRRLDQSPGLLGKWFKSARIDSIRPGWIEVSFETALSGLIGNASYREELEEAAAEVLSDIWDGAWRVEVGFDDADPTDEHQRSLARETEEKDEARRERARELIANHELVVRACDIFSPKRTRVILDEEEGMI